MRKNLFIILALMLICVFAFSSCDYTAPPESSGDDQQSAEENNDNNNDTEENNSSSDTATQCHHTFGDWSIIKQTTCKEEGKRTRTCNKCAQIEEESIPKNETHTAVIDAAVPASCKDTGLTEGSHCSVCNKVLVAQTVVPKTEDHTPVTDAAVPASCKNTGLTEGSHCSVCNKVLVAQTVVPKTEDHTPVTDAAVPASCKNTGITEGSHCSVCNKVLVAQTVVPKTEDHTLVTDAAVPASCKNTGLTEGSHCSVCNTVFVKQQTIPKADHEYKNYVCKNCGDQIYSKGLSYKKVSGGYKLIGLGSCTDTDIIVPSTYKGQPVLSIGSEAFLIDSASNEVTKSIILCEGIKTIEEKAFAWCKAVESITLPDSIEAIGAEAFLYNKSLKSIIIPEKVTVISKAMFRDCHGLKSITLGSQITTIENWAFDSCGIESLTLPNTVTHIGQGAFLESSIKTCNIPENLTNLGVEAFYKSDIEEIVFGGNLAEISARAFKDCDSLKSVTFNSSITKIGESAFNHASNLETVIFSVGLTEIAKEAFCYCPKITTLLLPQGLISIGEEAFRYSERLTELTLPSTLSKVEDGAFIYCKRLKFVTVPASLIDGGATIFANCGLESVHFEDGSTTVYASMFSDCSQLREVYLPQTLTTIQAYAFKGCSSLAISDLPFSLTTVDTSAFKGCTFKNFALTSAHENIAGLFNGAKIENLSLTDNLKKISDNMFSNTDITSIKIPEGVIEIGENAFSNCKSLTEISFPSTLERIHNSAFSGCANISELNLPANLKHIGNNAFDGLVLLQTLVLPKHLESIGASAFANCKILSEISVPNLDIEGVFQKCNISTVFFYGTKDEAQTYICKVFPYSSNVQIYCTDGIPIRLVYSYKVYETDIIWSLTSDGILTISGHGTVPYLNTKIPYETLVTKLVIGEGITNFEISPHNESSFKSFTNISEVEFASTLVSFDKELLKGSAWYETFNSGSEAIYFGEKLVMVPSSLSGLFTVKDGTVTIGQRAFAKCAEISEIVLPLSVKTIESYAFSGCENLLTLTLHEGITVIQQYAIFECNSLTELTIPSTVTAISHVVSNCSNLKKIVISDNSTLSLNGSIAAYCDSLETVIIGTGVSEFPINTLYECSSLKYIIIRGNITKMNYSAFWNTPNNRKFLCYDENTVALLKEKYADCVYLYSESEPTENGQFWGFSNNGEIIVY